MLKNIYISLDVYIYIYIYIIYTIAIYKFHTTDTKHIGKSYTHSRYFMSLLNP